MSASAWRTLAQFRALLEAAGLRLVRHSVMPTDRCFFECAATIFPEERR